MHLGVALFATDLTSDVRDVARTAEDVGFESLFVAEHTHIPTSRATPYPMGGELPEEYARTGAWTNSASSAKSMILSKRAAISARRIPRSTPFKNTFSRPVSSGSNPAPSCKSGATRHPRNPGTRIHGESLAL